VLHAFIDTNVYLNFFSFTDAELEELRKLHAAVSTGELKLWTTSQVANELRRNRETKVADSLARLAALKPSYNVPQMARTLPDFAAFKTARGEFIRQLELLDKELRRQFSAYELAADAVLDELLSVAESIPLTDNLHQRACRRLDVGNPPGKKGSLGDALNWEALLEACPQGVDLHVLSADNDFVSKMDSERVSDYLASEWLKAKGSRVYLHRQISTFLTAHFPDIELATELEKELRINQLIGAGTFEATHAAIERIAPYAEFNDEQARRLLEAAVTNTQISWISHDSDVKAFYVDLIRRHRHLIDKHTQQDLNELFPSQNVA
jgi:PIN domain